jgi:hypothetical protein
MQIWIRRQLADKQEEQQAAGRAVGAQQQQQQQQRGSWQQQVGAGSGVLLQVAGNAAVQ